MNVTFLNSAISRTIALTTILSLLSIAGTANAQSGVMPVPGEIAVSEIMFDPSGVVDDNDGEYFEITNISTRILDFSDLYIQDTETAGSATAPYVRIPQGALPLLYPGEVFVFARSNNSAVNGALPVVHYTYSVPTGTSAPADKSKVSHTGMSFNNSAVDSISITSGAPFNMGGFVIEMVTYDPTKAPYVNHAGIGFERSNLLGPWATTNVAASTATFGSGPQSGTPGMHNSNDSTLYPCYYSYTAIQPQTQDTGVLSASGPASIHGGTAILNLSNGRPGELFAFAVAPEAAEFQLFGGTVLVNLAQADLWALDNYVFDANGRASLTVPVAPELAGMPIYLQWFCYDFANGTWQFSNALGVDVTP